MRPSHLYPRKDATSHVLTLYVATDPLLFNVYEGKWKICDPRRDATSHALALYFDTDPLLLWALKQKQTESLFWEFVRNRRHIAKNLT